MPNWNQGLTQTFDTAYGAGADSVEQQKKRRAEIAATLLESMKNKMAYSPQQLEQATDISSQGRFDLPTRDESGKPIKTQPKYIVIPSAVPGGQPTLQLLPDTVQDIKLDISNVKGSPRPQETPEQAGKKAGAVRAAQDAADAAAGKGRSKTMTPSERADQKVIAGFIDSLKKGGDIDPRLQATALKLMQKHGIDTAEFTKAVQSGGFDAWWDKNAPSWLGGKGGGEPSTKKSFATEAEAEAAHLPSGTKITIGGRPAQVP